MVLLELVVVDNVEAVELVVEAVLVVVLMVLAVDDVVVDDDVVVLIVLAGALNHVLGVVEDQH